MNDTDHRLLDLRQWAKRNLDKMMSVNHPTDFHHGVIRAFEHHFIPEIDRMRAEAGEDKEESYVDPDLEVKALRAKVHMLETDGEPLNTLVNVRQRIWWESLHGRLRGHDQVVYTWVLSEIDHVIGTLTPCQPDADRATLPDQHAQAQDRGDQRSREADGGDAPRVDHPADSGGPDPRASR